MGKSERFKKGQRCYTPEGLAVEYVGAAQGGYLALRVYVDEEDREWPDDTPQFYRTLYAKPRTQALAADRRTHFGPRRRGSPAHDLACGLDARAA